MLTLIRTETFPNNWLVEIYHDSTKSVENCVTCIVKKNGVIVDNMPVELGTGTLAEMHFSSISELLKVVFTKATFDE